MERTVAWMHGIHWAHKVHGRMVHGHMVHVMHGEACTMHLTGNWNSPAAAAVAACAAGHLLQIECGTLVRLNSGPCTKQCTQMAVQYIKWVRNTCAFGLSTEQCAHMALGSS